MYTQVRDYIGPRGGNWAFMVKNQAAIGQFISQQKIAPLGPIGAANVGAAAVERSRIFDPGIYGGIKVAHLHFDNKIYLLTDEQWTAFSGTIAGRLKSKLARTKVIPFDVAMDVGSKMDVRIGG